MNRLISSIVIAALILIVGCFRMSDTQDLSVHFEIATIYPLSEDEYIYITGNTVTLGEWNPEGARMNRVDDLHWETSLFFPPGTELEFKFTKGSWSHEAIDENCVIPENDKLIVMSDSKFRKTIYGWRDSCEKKPGITGDYEFIESVSSEFLEQNRNVIVWLPPSYNHTNNHYPVLYMHDGQNVFDHLTSSFGSEWRIDEIVTDLITREMINEIIVVAVYNTTDRSAEYAPTKKGNHYTRFMIEELMPMVNGRYRTKTGPENTAVMGSSLGGLIAFDLAWENPEVFGKAGCLSPAYLVNKDEILKRVKKDKSAYKNVKFYMDCGTLGVDKEILPGYRKMIKILHKKGYVDDVNLLVFEDAGADHTEAAWAGRVHKPLLFFFGK